MTDFVGVDLTQGSHVKLDGLKAGSARPNGAYPLSQTSVMAD